MEHDSHLKMSGHQAGITDDELNELISKLQSLLPESSRRGAASRWETCRYIRSLHLEVDNFSNRLTELMATMDGDSPQADIIRSLLRSL